MYRAGTQGGIVFGAGTAQWSWGLDGHHDSPSGVPAERENFLNIRVGVDPHAPDIDLQQATVNLFADMGVQPACLHPRLVPAAASLDVEAPTVVFVSPRPGKLFQDDEPVKVSVAAWDVSGGQVASVEVSVDNGVSWHPALRESDEAATATAWPAEVEQEAPSLSLWTASLVAQATQGSPVVRVLARAVDDSLNLGATEGRPIRVVQAAKQSHHEL
mmetsp:Transcript_25821/g.60984  ORF Transcript_25821/g.60984 Transcript_25821/m.60984 type:complete len:216 (-) Transcript_25821:22-669(-)